MNRRHHPLWIATLVVSGLCCARPGQLGRTETAHVLEVIDGDTIRLTDGREVRYAAVDTPERGDPFYEGAKALNASFVAGKKVTLHYGRRRTDRYGRTLAVVTQNGIAVGDSLVAAGLAIVYGFSDNAELLPALIPLQRRAIDQKIGLWSLPRRDDEDHYVASMSGHRFHRPDCPWVATIKLQQLREYRSKIDAYYDGLSPCNSCRPDTVKSTPPPADPT